MKKVLMVLMLVSLHLVSVSADTVFSIGALDTIEEETIGDLTYRKITLSDNGDTHLIYNAEIPSDASFEVVLHDRMFNEVNYGLSTVLEIAEDYEATHDKVVYAAVNGDYFSGGIPVDFYAVENKILRVGPYSYSLGKNAFGFDNEGNSIVGKVEYGYKISIHDSNMNLLEEVHIDQINDPLNDGEIGLYTFNYTSTITGNNIAKMSITFDEISGNYAYPYEGTLKGSIDDFTFNDDNYSIHYKDFVIAAKGNSESYDILKNTITSDSIITVYPYPVGDWLGMEYIIGGWQVLMNNGTLLPDAIHNGGSSLAPRTSIGIKADGTIGITVLDGRLTSVPGLNINELGILNQELGYINALELDGGGSSTFLLRNLETNQLEIMNQPSDGSLRNVANAVLIVGDPLPVDCEVFPDHEDCIIDCTITPEHEDCVVDCSVTPGHEDCALPTPTCSDNETLINGECVVNPTPEPNESSNTLLYILIGGGVVGAVSVTIWILRFKK